MLTVVQDEAADTSERELIVAVHAALAVLAAIARDTVVAR